MDKNVKTFSTRLHILRSVDKPLNKITVNEICENANISRQTFYNHFESKYMLRSWWSEYCEQRTLDSIGISMSWEEGSIRYAQMMLSVGSFIFRSAANDWAGPEPYEVELLSRRSEALREACAYRNIEVTADLDYCIELYARSFRLCGNEISALGEEAIQGLNMISRRFIAIIPALLYDALQLPCFKKRNQLENYQLIDTIVWKILNSTTEPESYSAISEK